MNRIENIILTLAVAAALIAANTVEACPDSKCPCPETGVTNERPAKEVSEDPRDGLLGEPVVKTQNSTRSVRDLELEEANLESGMGKKDGLPGLPRVKTKTGYRLPRDVNLERVNRGKEPYPTDGPCPEDMDEKRRKTAENDRTRTANEAGSLLKHHTPKLPGFSGTRTKDGELVDRDRLMDSLKDAANKNKNLNNKKDANKNTTFEDTLRRAGIDPADLEGAKYKHFDSSTKITMSDGTVIWTGPDEDELGTSVTKPNGDQIEVSPDGRVSTRRGQDGDTITHHPSGTTTLYDPKQKTLTVTDKHGRTMTHPLDFYMSWFGKGWSVDDLLDLLNPRPGQKDKGNTTLHDTLRRAGVSADDLKNAKSIETSEHSNSVKITLQDGTEIWTGPDSDGYGSSVTKPSGDQTEVFPDGRVSTRQGKDGHTVTTHPDGTTTDYNPEDDTMTVRDGKGNSETRTMEYWQDWYKQGHTPQDLLRLYNPE